MKKMAKKKRKVVISRTQVERRSHAYAAGKTVS
jgi:hypothetical protein